jgi:hypothetical protein
MLLLKKMSEEPVRVRSSSQKTYTALPSAEDVTKGITELCSLVLFWTFGSCVDGNGSPIRDSKLLALGLYGSSTGSVLISKGELNVNPLLLLLTR